VVLQYLHPREGLPDRKGDLSSSISSRTIALANYEIQEELAKQPVKKHGKYLRYAIDSLIFYKHVSMLTMSY